jgi:signal transduction histidine kinase
MEPNRQTKILRFFFLGYGITAAFAAQQLLASSGQSLAGLILVMLACAILPLYRLQEDNLPFLRSALSWTVAGAGFLGVMGLLNVVGALGQSNLSKIIGHKGPVFFSLFCLILSVRNALYPGPQSFALTTLFSTPNSAPSLRSAYEEQIRQAAGQEERNRLARDLHDSIKQQIFAIQTCAAAAQARFDSDASGARAALDGVRSSAREAMVEMEAMLDQLRATPLETVGLVEALKKQCEALQYRAGAHVAIDLAEVPAPGELQPGAAQSLFRIAQEALANIARHARASEVKLSLYKAGKDCVLEIEDNGSGFAPEDGQRKQPGMGLSNMRTRAAEQGGSVVIRSAPGEGTLLTVTIPLASLAEKPVDGGAFHKTFFHSAWLLGGAAVFSAGVSFLIPSGSQVLSARFMALGFFLLSIGLFARGRRA